MCNEDVSEQVSAKLGIRTSSVCSTQSEVAFATKFCSFFRIVKNIANFLCIICLKKVSSAGGVS